MAVFCMVIVLGIGCKAVDTQPLTVTFKAKVGRSTEQGLNP